MTVGKEERDEEYLTVMDTNGRRMGKQKEGIAMYVRVFDADGKKCLGVMTKSRKKTRPTFLPGNSLREIPVTRQKDLINLFRAKQGTLAFLALTHFSGCFVLLVIFA